MSKAAGVISDGNDLFASIPMGYEAALLGLGKDQCRWPISDPDKSDFHFCSEKQDRTQKTLYCAGHAWDARHVKGGKRPAAVTPAPAGQVRDPSEAGIPPILTNKSPAKKLSPAVAVENQ